MAHAWSGNSRESGGVIDYLGEDNEFLIKFAKKKIKEDQSINYFVFGHRHLLLNLPISESSNVVMLGDWITLFSYAVFDGERLELKKWEE